MDELLIPHKNLLSGARHCIDNGLRFRLDAEILFGARRYKSAHILGVYSIEEFGKATFLAKKYYDGQGVTKREYNKIFRDHPAKIAYQLQQTAHILEEKYHKETKEWFLRMSVEEHQRKLRSIYVDWVNGKWSTPTIADREESRAQAIEAKKTASFCWNFADQALKGKGVVALKDRATKSKSGS